jgi:hypothetical protein
LGDVFFQAEASSLKFHLEACLTLLEALTELLFKARPNTSTQLVFSFGQQSLMALFKTPDLLLFHLDESLFHFLLEVGFNLSETMLQFLIVIKFQPLFLDGEAPVVFLVQLALNRGLQRRLSLLQPLVLLNIVLLSHGFDSPFKSEVQFVANA